MTPGWPQGWADPQRLAACRVANPPAPQLEAGQGWLGGLLVDEVIAQCGWP